MTIDQYSLMIPKMLIYLHGVRAARSWWGFVPKMSWCSEARPPIWPSSRRIWSPRIWYGYGILIPNNSEYHSIVLIIDMIFEIPNIIFHIFQRLVVWNHGFLWLSIQKRECHHPNWRTHIFQRGRRVGIPPTGYTYPICNWGTLW